MVELWESINYDEYQNMETTCEYEIEWGSYHDRLRVFLTEPDTADRMVTFRGINTFTNPSHQPQPWLDSNPIPLTICHSP